MTVSLYRFRKLGRTVAGLVPVGVVLSLYVTGYQVSSQSVRKGCMSDGPIHSVAAEVCPLNTGAAIPAHVTVVDRLGRPVSLGEILRKGPVVLMFDPDTSPGVDSAQLKALKEFEGDLKASGYRIVGVTPGRLDALALRTDLEIYGDVDGTVAQAFGIAYVPTLEERLRRKLSASPAVASLSVPSVFVIDAGGTIRHHYATPDPKTRLSPEKTLAAVRAFAGAAK